MQIKELCRIFCILAVHFKEISDLEKHHVVGMVVLNIVVCVHVPTELQFTGLYFLISGFFFGGEISVVSDNAVEPLCDFIPVQFHIGTIWLA